MVSWKDEHSYTSSGEAMRLRDELSKLVSESQRSWEKAEIGAVSAVIRYERNLVTFAAS